MSLHSILEVTDTPVPDFVITATHHVRSCSIPNVGSGFDFEAACAGIDWLRSQVQNTGSSVKDAVFTAGLDDLVNPTAVILGIEWTPPFIATE